MLKKCAKQDLSSSSNSLLVQRMISKTRKQSVARLKKANEVKDEIKEEMKKENGKGWKDLYTSEPRDDEKIYEFLVAKFEKRMVLIASIYQYLLGPDFAYHVGQLGPEIDVQRNQKFVCLQAVFRLW